MANHETDQGQPPAHAEQLNLVIALVEAIRASLPEDTELVLAVFLEELWGDDPLPELVAGQSDASFGQVWQGSTSCVPL